MNTTEKFAKITAEEARTLRDAEINRKVRSEEQNINEFLSYCSNKIRRDASYGYSNVSIYNHTYIKVSNNDLTPNIVKKTSEKLRKLGFDVTEHDTYLYISF
mgnify:CR=1 FL=1